MRHCQKKVKQETRLINDLTYFITEYLHNNSSFTFVVEDDTFSISNITSQNRYFDIQ